VENVHVDMQIDGNRIRSERERRAWSQEHLAEAAGLSLRTVQRIERSEPASFETARALASVLEIDVATLTGQKTRTRTRYWAVAATVVAGLLGLFVAQQVQAAQVLLDVNLSLNEKPLSQSQLITAEGKNAEIRLEGQMRVIIAPVIQPDGSVLLSLSVDEFASRWVRIAEPKLQAIDNDEAVLSVTSPSGNVMRSGIRPHKM
jgi:transcriptional regulator with XRE-family HTH domain